MPRNNGSTKQAIDIETIYHLFQDVSRLPIIINRAQELLLGIHLRAERRAKEFNTSLDDSVSIAKTTIEAIEALIDWCRALSRPLCTRIRSKATPGSGQHPMH